MAQLSQQYPSGISENNPYSLTPSFLSQNGEDLASQLMAQMEQDIKQLKPKDKDKPTLSQTLPPKHSDEPHSMLKQRLDQHLHTIQHEIGRLEKRCDKFGGREHMRGQMRKQTVSPQEKAKFIKKRLLNVNGLLSLPKITQRRGHRDQDLVTLHEKLCERARSRSTKAFNEYNKWYIRPESRFGHSSKEKSSKPPSVTKYIEEVLCAGAGKKQIALTFGEELVKNSLVKNSLVKLGREPLLCKNTKIRQI